MGERAASYWISIEPRFHAAVYNLATLIDIVFPIACRLSIAIIDSAEFPAAIQSLFPRSSAKKLQRVMSRVATIVHCHRRESTRHRVNRRTHSRASSGPSATDFVELIRISARIYSRVVSSRRRGRFNCLVKSARGNNAFSYRRALVSKREMERPFADRCKIEGPAYIYGVYISTGAPFPAKCRTVYIRITEHSVNCRS